MATPPHGRLNALVLARLSADLGMRPERATSRAVLGERDAVTKAGEGRLELSLRTHDSIRSIGRERWNELDSADEAPQLAFEWLDALERTGCVSAERGWLPLHLTLQRGEEILAAAPAYLKGNSEGEFVFDHSWARFAEGSLGIDYYPS